MNRPLQVLIVLLLAGALYLVFGGGGAEDPREFGPDPLDALGPATAVDPLGAEAPDAPPAIHVDDTGVVGTSSGGGAPRRQQVLQIEGRVVDDRRRPVAEVQVELRQGTRKLAAATSDAQGRYEVTVRRMSAQRALVVGTAPDGRIGTASLWAVPGAGGRMLAPTLVLEAVAALRVRILRDGAPVEGARVVVAKRSAGAPTPIATHRTGPTGVLTVAGLPQGPIEVFASAPGSGRGHLALTLPQGEPPIADLALPAERTLAVRVIDARTKRAIAGAEILLGDKLSMPQPDGPGFLPPVEGVRTDDMGRARLSNIAASDTVYVNARAKGYVLAPWWRHQPRGIPPDQKDVEIELERHRRVEFLVGSGNVPPPQSGAALYVELPAHALRAAGKLSATIDGEILIVDGLPSTSVRGLVRADGVQAEFTAPPGATQGPMVEFRGERSVTLHVVDADGAEAPGIPLELRASGSVGRIEPATTDAAGLAVFRGVGADKVTVHRAHAGRPAGGAVLATLDLTDGRASYEVRLLPTARLTLHVQIDGEPRLPSGYVLTVGSAPVPEEEVTEDPERGVISAQFRTLTPDQVVVVRFAAHGFVAVEETLDPGRHGGYELDVELETAATIVAEVKPPADGRFGVNLQVWSPKSRSWQHAQAVPAGRPGVDAPPVPGSRVSWTGLDGGRYRAMDTHSHAVSAPVDVARGETRTISLDLTSVGWIEGVVVAPAGANLRLARVLVVEQAGSKSPWTGAAVQEDGSFRLRGARGGGMTLEVTHPTLRPAREGGRAKVGTGPVRLRLEAGGEARFSLPAGDMAPGAEPAIWLGSLQVHLFRGEPKGEAARVVRPVADAGGYRFGGFEPGTYTVWIGFGGRYAPAVLRDVKLGDGLTDLGAIETRPGTTLRVRVRSGGGEAPEKLWITAVHLGSPPYTRTSARADADEEPACTGLGPGTFRVSVRLAGAQAGLAGGPALYDKEVTVDGKTDKVIDVTLP